MDWTCMEFVATGSSTGKQLRSNRSIRDPTCGDLEILLVLIQLGVTGLKKVEFVFFLQLLRGRGKKGRCALVYLRKVEFVFFLQLLGGRGKKGRCALVYVERP